MVAEKAELVSEKHCIVVKFNLEPSLILKDQLKSIDCNINNLESGIDIGQGINIGQKINIGLGKCGQKKKPRALKER